jgi:chemotaxis protein MotB
MVVGKAESEPLIPNNPTLAHNRRVTVNMMREDPPLPPAFKQ